MSVTGLVFFDGGNLETEPVLHHGYNRLTIYQGSTLPGIGLVMQNTTRLASGYDIYANMVSKDGNVVFVNRSVELSSRRMLNPDYPDDDPVFIVWLASGDVVSGGIYDLQIRAIDQTSVTGQEFLRPYEIEILPRLASGL